MKWEYLVIQISIPVDTKVMADYLAKLREHLNEYGGHGWELVHITAVGSVHYFKRPLATP
jgi:hypothetical protein